MINVSAGKVQLHVSAKFDCHRRFLAEIFNLLKGKTIMFPLCSNPTRTEEQICIKRYRSHLLGNNKSKNSLQNFWDEV